jgi:hypothetical protein
VLLLLVKEKSLVPLLHQRTSEEDDGVTDITFFFADVLG